MKGHLGEKSFILSALSLPRPTGFTTREDPFRKPLLARHRVRSSVRHCHFDLAQQVHHLLPWVSLHLWKQAIDFVAVKLISSLQGRNSLYSSLVD